MNHAPAVQYPVGRSVWANRFLLVLVALWLLTQGLWLAALQGQTWPSAWWVSTLAGLAGMAWALWRARHPLLGELQWHPGVSVDGRRGSPGEWRWVSAAYRHGTVLVRLDRVLDAQSFVLLRARTSAGLTLWLWLEAGVEPALWDGLRRALQAHGGPAGGVGSASAARQRV